MPVIKHLLGKAAGDSIAERWRAAHWAEGFMIEEGKSWKVSNRPTNRVAHTECRPTAQGFKLALDCHSTAGHLTKEKRDGKVKGKLMGDGLPCFLSDSCFHHQGFGPVLQEQPSHKQSGHIQT